MWGQTTLCKGREIEAEDVFSARYTWIVDWVRKLEGESGCALDMRIVAD